MRLRSQIRVIELKQQQKNKNCYSKVRKESASQLKKKIKYLKSS